MRAPWLDMQNALSSLGGFAELQKIGHSLASLRPFDDRLTEILRADLGDWRDNITWPKAILDDLGARSDFYVERGLNSDLTNFPALAFAESLEVAGILREPPSLVERYGSPLSVSEDKDFEEDLERTNRAHNFFLRFETQLRNFIDEKMTEAFGSEWPKQRLPNGLYDKWQEKKHKAENSRELVFPIICYADFTDYVHVICKRDNWRQVFEPFFGRMDSVRESFQRLYVPRISTMHARPITQDDELFIFVEIKRLGRVIK
ncbi:Swt1 family HEPN domain-containing protein [Methylobacter svalbardensis]|uniref:Swt1 family HEPN domain-containing protein n=1 Tax=Methylobacter svalbardensis TaxID=3080016 RepID=UPI0030EF6026